MFYAFFKTNLFSKINETSAFREYEITPTKQGSNYIISYQLRLKLHLVDVIFYMTIGVLLLVVNFQ